MAKLEKIALDRSLCVTFALAAYCSQLGFSQGSLVGVRLHDKEEEAQ